MPVTVVFYDNATEHMDFYLNYKTFVGQDSVVGIETCHGQDGPAIESRWGNVFHTHPDWTWGPTQPPVWILCLCPRWGGGLKQPRCGIDHPPLTRAEVKERVELYLYPPQVFIAFSSMNFTFSTTELLLLTIFKLYLGTSIKKDNKTMWYSRDLTNRNILPCF